MTSLGEPDTEQLLERVAAGERAARELLLDRHRKRLRRMIELRLDRRLWVRVDPSDVLQETLLEADQKAGAAWALSTRPRKSRWAGGWP